MARRRGAAPGSGGWGRGRVRVSGRGSPGGGGEEAEDPQHRVVALVVEAAEGSGAGAGELVGERVSPHGGGRPRRRLSRGPCSSGGVFTGRNLKDGLPKPL